MHVAVDALTASEQDGVPVPSTVADGVHQGDKGCSECETEDCGYGLPQDAVVCRVRGSWRMGQRLPVRSMHRNTIPSAGYERTSCPLSTYTNGRLIRASETHLMGSRQRQRQKQIFLCAKDDKSLAEGEEFLGKDERVFLQRCRSLGDSRRSCRRRHAGSGRRAGDLRRWEE